MADSTAISTQKKKDLSNLDVTKLTAISPEVISKQATINIGTIGHVAHGKSTVVKALSGVQTVRFKNELERNITIKLDKKEKGGGSCPEMEVPSSTDDRLSTLIDDDEEELQVLAEIQSTMANLKQIPLSSTNEEWLPAGSQLPSTIESPPRPSVIQHTTEDAIPSTSAKRNILTEINLIKHRFTKTKVEKNNGECERKSTSPPLVKRRPGPKSKTSYVDEMADTTLFGQEYSNSKTDLSINCCKLESDVDHCSVNVSESEESYSNAEYDISNPKSSSQKKKLSYDSEFTVNINKFGRGKRRFSQRKGGNESDETSSDSEDRNKRKRRRGDRLRSRSPSRQNSKSPNSKLRPSREQRDIPTYKDTSSDSDDPPKRRSLKVPIKFNPSNADLTDSNEHADMDKKTSEGSSSKGKNKNKKTFNQMILSGYKSRRSRNKKKKRKSVIQPKQVIAEEDMIISMSVGRQKDGEYEVEKVIDTRKMDGQLQYFVKWRGWPSLYNTWEPMENLVNSQELLLEYFQTISLKKLNRLKELADKIDGLEALPSKFAEYERNMVETLKQEHFQGLVVKPIHELAESLPSFRLLCSHISKVTKNSDADLEEKILKLIIKREFLRRRYEQLEAMKLWEEDMKEKFKEAVPLLVENNVDLEGRPENFTFISHNISGEGVTIPDDPPVGCECSSCNEESSCCGKQSGSQFSYSPEGLLIVPHGTPVYECNKRCKCSMECQNRVVQNGRTVPLTIFRTANNTGWGVKVMEDVPLGKFICEYVGEVLPKLDADKRLRSEYKNRPLYIFDLDFNDSKEFPYTVDAYKFGNVSHFINHACEPNLAVFAVWIDCLDPNLPRLAMFAIRDIKAGEELTFDYSAQYHKKRKQQVKTTQPRQGGKNPCRCGSSICRQVLF